MCAPEVCGCAHITLPVISRTRTPVSLLRTISDNLDLLRSTFLAHAFHAHETTVGHGFIYTTSDSGVSESRARGALRDSRTLASHTLSLRSTVSTRVSQPRTRAHTSARLSHALLYGSCCVASCARVTLCPVSHLRPAHVSRFDPKVPPFSRKYPPVPKLSPIKVLIFQYLRLPMRQS